MKRIAYITIMIFAFWTMNGQNLSEAVRYSFVSPIGTAGFAGLSGSTGALGGDFSSVFINPAGLAEYRQGVFAFTPSFKKQNTTSYFNGSDNRIDADENTIALNNLGVVFSKPSGFRNSFMIGYNKIKNFDRSYNIQGVTLGSRAERYIELANGGSFEGDLAIDGGVVYDLDGDGNYESDFFNDDMTDKNQVVAESGSINALNAAWAFKIGSMLNFGVTGNIYTINYEESKNYVESIVGVENLTTDLQVFDNLTTTGSGLSINFGMQFIPIPQLRMGLAINSPIYYTLEDEYTSTLMYSIIGEDLSFIGEQVDSEGFFEYKYKSPWKATGSIGTVFKLGPVNGIANIDAEFVDYAANNYDLGAFSDNPGDIQYSSILNNDISTQLTDALNLRFGLELAIAKLRVRGGLAMYESPYMGDEEKMNTYSLGIGYRINKVFLDLAYQSRQFNEGYNVYALENNERNALATIENTSSRISATIGFKF